MKSNDVKAPQDLTYEGMILTILSISQEKYLPLQMISKEVSFLRKYVIPSFDDDSDNE